MDFTVTSHLSYLTISIALTVWVAHTLQKNGRVFLVDAFGREDLADSVNHLLVVGFYLVNLGFVAFNIHRWTHGEDWGGLIEDVTMKVGLVLIILGGMHFFNLLIFWNIRRRGQATPPAVPEGYRHTQPAPQ